MRSWDTRKEMDVIGSGLAAPPTLESAEQEVSMPDTR